METANSLPKGTAMKKTTLIRAVVAALLSLSLLIAGVGCRQAPSDENNGVSVERPTGNFTRQDAVSVPPTNWNPHTYEGASDAYPLDFLTVGLYTFVYNDELHPVEGKEPFTSYAVMPEMAASLPVDVTETVKETSPAFGIPPEATAGYAYTIDLNPAATWEDGTPINADTYVESMKRLLDPRLLNYRATDYYDGDLAIAGARAYAKGEGEWSSVGLLKSGEHQITLVLEKSLAGFGLLYNLSGNWLVHPALYDSCIRAVGDTYRCTYGSGVDSTMSYGPYRLVSHTSDTALRFERNETWYGYTDGRHIYRDPRDGKYYPMYQTTAIDCRVVAEAETRKLMFLKGQLSTYDLQADDYDTYRTSDYAYATPGTSTFFLILNGHRDAIEAREAARDFDKNTTDLECLMLESFKRGMALSYDRSRFAATVSPARRAGLGLIGTTYVYDPESGARYRDTPAAKRALCDFYAVNVDDFPSLDAATASITGYDAEAARSFFRTAFREALDRGYITDRDGDGRSDQTVRIQYCVAADSDQMTAVIGYLNSALSEVLVGTPFEGRVEFYKSAPFGNDWFRHLTSGMSDTVLGGWSGSAMDPFGLTDLYTNPGRAYDAGWFDAESISLTLTVPAGTDTQNVTMSLRQWSQALNGATVRVGERTYNFGVAEADANTRLSILAALETRILQAYNYIPMLEDASVTLLSRQAYYVVEEYDPLMARGGLAYMRYNYTDEAWEDYVASEGGVLSY